MFELTIDVLDPDISRFQLYLAIFIALVAIFITVLKTLVAERQADRHRVVLAEMREYKEKARQEEARRRQVDMKKWEQGEDWPVGREGDEGQADKKDDKREGGEGRGKE
jgi:uncharacterized membrane protein (DUF106 family)